MQEFFGVNLSHIYNIFININVNFAHTGSVTAISAPWADIGAKLLITRYQASREPHDVTSAQLSFVAWKMQDTSKDAFVGVLFNTMLKYVINRLMYNFFHIRTVIIPRPISTLGLKPSGRYRFLGMITVLIWKRACINL